MRRNVPRPVLWIAGLSLALAACGGDGAVTTTTTAPASTTTAPTTTTSTTTTSTTTTTTLPGGPGLAEEGDKNEIVAAFQFLLNCNDYGDLEVDGNFGPATRAAVEAAQEDLGRQVNGTPDEETLAELSRSCEERRRFDGEEFTIVGNASPEDPEKYEVALSAGSTLTVAAAPSTGLTLTLTDPDENPVEPGDPLTWDIAITADYLLEVTPADAPMTFSLDLAVTDTVRETGDWILATDGLIYKDTKLALGSNAGNVITKVFQFLGHGVRGNLDEFDTDWYTITDPSDMGLRGIFIEGFALLFYGPDPNNPTRPETFARWRFVGPSVDADGQPRPENYATTAAGITVGDTLADLKSAYGGDVSPGSNDDEHWYRLVYSTGDICFYFEGDAAPTDASPISEISSECRFG